MTKQDWIRKLTSRKFWVALAGLVAGLVSFLRNPSTDVEKITGLILSLGAVVAYVVGEGLVDASRAPESSADPAPGSELNYFLAGSAVTKPPEPEPAPIPEDYTPKDPTPQDSIPIIDPSSPVVAKSHPFEDDDLK